MPVRLKKTSSNEDFVVSTRWIWQPAFVSKLIIFGLPGDQESLIWKDYYKFEELPQVLNPTSGFLQNCNSSPFLATDGDDNPIESAFPKNMGIETFQTNRALRAMELFSSDTSITKEE